MHIIPQNVMNLPVAKTSQSKNIVNDLHRFYLYVRHICIYVNFRHFIILLMCMNLCINYVIVYVVLDILLLGGTLHKTSDI